LHATLLGDNGTFSALFAFIVPIEAAREKMP
jgi:hypothetical protein